MALWAPPELYDQGIYLATGRFAADGLVPYRDFHYPYGPGLAYVDAAVIWLGADSLLVHRSVWAAAAFALSLLLLRLADRHDLLPVGVAVAAILVVAPVPAIYVFPALLVVAAVDRFDRCRRPSSAGLLLVAAAVWFRWEYLGVLGLAAALLFLAGRGQRTVVVAWAGLATVVAVAPYILLSWAGAFSGMREVVEYSIGSFATYRGLPYPRDAPLHMVRDVLSGDAGALVQDSVRFVGYLLAPAAVLVATFARFGRGDAREVWLTPAPLLALSWAAVSMYSLAVRSDAFHAAPLVVTLAVLLLLVLPSRLPWTSAAAAVIAASAVLLLVPRAIGLWALHATPPHGLSATVADARALLKSGDELFVGNRDNSEVFVNAPYLYWALEARPASRVFQFEPGHADQRRVQEAIVEDLCRHNAVVVLWDAPEGEHHGYGDSAVLDEFLDTAYRVVAENGDFQVLTQRAAPGCP